MAARHSSVRWVLILLVVGLVGVGAAVAAWWTLPSALHLANGSSTRQVSATVITSVPCGGPDARDQVEIRIDGRATKALLDGCGHREGDILQVDVPVNELQTNLVVQIAGTSPAGNQSLQSRLTVVLLVLSAIAGAAYSYLIRATRTRVQPRRS